MLVLGLVLGVTTAVAMLAARAQRGVRCPAQVVIVRGRTGEAVECVCVDGVLAGCFAPGP